MAVQYTRSMSVLRLSLARLRRYSDKVRMGKEENSAKGCAQVRLWSLKGMEGKGRESMMEPGSRLKSGNGQDSSNGRHGGEAQDVCVLEYHRLMRSKQRPSTAGMNNGWDGWRRLHRSEATRDRTRWTMERAREEKRSTGMREMSEAETRRGKGCGCMASSLRHRLVVHAGFQVV